MNLLENIDIFSSIRIPDFELEGIFSCKIRNSEELSKLCDSKVKEMCRERKELERDGIIESLRYCLNSNLADKKNKQILELLTKSY
ncbi:hypothetical protein BpHYR1_033896 [Brachionus plicatilis]|uniref:Uncharacterized protein n=1 Tax=Brachionus plicatilis TaxID=10195 RepID=A0A3M7S6A4_BRAPC|nr:hypothetical protein BpHYR1_033896 [Brachionus plicatilis]